MKKEKLNELLKSVNRNMDNYNKDINLRMQISDDLEIKRLKQSAERLCKDFDDISQEFPQNDDESLDLIEESKIQNEKKALLIKL